MFSYGYTTTFWLSPIAPFVFFTTLLVYNGQRYYKMSFTDILTNTPRIEWMRKNKKLVESILAAALIGVIILGLPLLFSGSFNLVIISSCALISIFYVIKVGKKNLREVSGLKVFLITIVYFIIICILPFQSMIRLNLSLQPISVWLLFLVCQYLYILGVTVLFDIPDLGHDDKSLRTLAQIVGSRRTVLISLFLLVPLLTYLTLNSINQVYIWFFILIHPPFYYFLIKKEDKHFYLSFMGEGILGLLGVYYYLI
jgi:hypothetical protein